MSKPDWLDKNVLIILITTFFTNVAAFLLLPYMMIYLTEDLHKSNSLAGLLIGMSYWLLQAGGIIAAPLVKKIGYRNLMFIGSSVRIPGYLFLIINSTTSIALGLALIGLGGGLFFGPQKLYS